VNYKLSSSTFLFYLFFILSEACFNQVLIAVSMSVSVLEGDFI